MSNNITINGKLKYEVPNSLMPKILDLVAPHETEESKEDRREHGMRDWPGSEKYQEELVLASIKGAEKEENKEVFK